MTEHNRTPSSESAAIAAAERSKADIAAGRVEDFNVVTTELRAYYEERANARAGHTTASRG